ncbi:MAG: HEAT repeat domain-containing protein, partial [Bdellovibrionales bacterium]
LKNTAFSETAEMKSRWRSVVEISKSQHPQREKDLMRGLKNSAWFMRNVSLLALHSINPNKGREEAIRLLEDPSLVVRSAAVEVLASSADSHSQVRQKLWSQLKNKKNKVQGSSLWIRSQLMQVLAQKPLPSERSLFLAFTEDSDSEVRSLARTSVSKLNN